MTTNTHSSDTHLGDMLRPGAVMERLGGRRRTSAATEYLAARKLDAIGVPLLKLGGAWWVPRASFEAWLADPACQAAAAAAQHARRRGAGRRSNAEQALRAAVARAMGQEG
ncbi:hypothetical protein [Metallibacterium scheffleri]